MLTPERLQQRYACSDRFVLDPVPADFQPMVTPSEALAVEGRRPVTRLVLALHTGSTRRMLPDGGAGEPVHARVPAWLAITHEVHQGVPGPFTLPVRREPYVAVGVWVTAIDATSGEMLEATLLPTEAVDVPPGSGLGDSSR